ncbi:glycoside hydrolase family 61 protein [Mycena olivaceomarginata]|nr:glycoside hydrolase family 61 protein [Mycena olivaceomarginata]
MAKFSSLVFSLLTVLTVVRGHGYVQQITAGSAVYTGYLPYTDPYYKQVFFVARRRYLLFLIVPHFTQPTGPQRIVRAIPGNGPITDLSLIDVQCNGWSEGGVIGSIPAPLYATVAAGTALGLNWTTWPDSHMGPMITYMALAPTNITGWQPGKAAVWFKVAQSGKNAAGLWAATDLLTASNSVYSFTIPQKLKPGQYIIRHEIIALHSAYTYPGAQVYPSCIQVQVTGSGTAVPPASSLVAFPGAYTATTPGIVYNAYTDTGRFIFQAYPIPGPAVWTP